MTKPHHCGHHHSGDRCPTTEPPVPPPPSTEHPLATIDIFVPILNLTAILSILKINKWKEN